MKREEFALLYRFANVPMADARPGWLRHLGLQSLASNPDWRSLVQIDPIASDVLRRIGPDFDWDCASDAGVVQLIRLSSRELTIVADGLGRIAMLAVSLRNDRARAGRYLNALRATHPKLRIPESLESWIDADISPSEQRVGTLAHGCGWLKAWLAYRSPTLWPRLRLRLPMPAASAPVSIICAPTEAMPPMLAAMIDAASLPRHGKD